MSHVATIDLAVTDLDALSVAAEPLGFELRRGQTVFARDSASEAGGLRVEHALRIKGTEPQMGYEGPWEIGVVKKNTGPGYTLAFDSFGPAGHRLTELAGAGLSKLKTAYTTEVSRRHLLKLGYRVNVVVNAQGQTQVVGVRA